MCLWCCWWWYNFVSGLCTGNSMWKHNIIASHKSIFGFRVWRSVRHIEPMFSRSASIKKANNNSKNGFLRFPFDIGFSFGRCDYAIYDVWFALSLSMTKLYLIANRMNKSFQITTRMKHSAWSDHFLCLITIAVINYVHPSPIFSTYAVNDATQPIENIPNRNSISINDYDYSPYQFSNPRTHTCSRICQAAAVSVSDCQWKQYESFHSIIIFFSLQILRACSAISIHDTFLYHICRHGPCSRRHVSFFFHFVSAGQIWQKKREREKSTEDDEMKNQEKKRRMKGRNRCRSVNGCSQIYMTAT